MRDCHLHNFFCLAGNHLVCCQQEEEKEDREGATGEKLEKRVRCSWKEEVSPQKSSKCKERKHKSCSGAVDQRGWRPNNC